VIGTGALVDGADAEAVGQWLWTVVHGVVSFELNGTIDLDAPAYDEYLRLSLVGFLI
jgi:hypothetical protein